MAVKLSVVIPTKGRPQLADTLNSIPDLDWVETVVVADGTHRTEITSTPEMLRSLADAIVAQVDGAEANSRNAMLAIGSEITLTYDAKVADPNVVDGSYVWVGIVTERYADGSFEFEPANGEQSWSVTAVDIERGSVAIDPKQVSA